MFSLRSRGDRPCPEGKHETTPEALRCARCPDQPVPRVLVGAGPGRRQEGSAAGPWAGHDAGAVRDRRRPVEAGPQAGSEGQEGRYRPGGRVRDRPGGHTTQARAVLDNARVAKSGDAALVLGSIPVQALPKLAAVPGVVAIQPIEMTRTGQPLTDPDPDLHKAPTAAERKTALAKVKADDVPYGEAPPLQGSNFEQLKSSNLLDAKTHNFTGAWNAGFAGEGSPSACSTAAPTSATRPDRAPGRPGPAQTGTDDRLERLAEGVRPVRHAAVPGRPEPGRPAACPGTRQTTRGDLRRAPARQRAAVHVRHADRPVAQLQRAGRHRARTPTRSRASWSEVRHGPPRQPPGRLPARALRRAGRRSWSPTRTPPASTTPSTSTSTTTTTSPTRSRSPRPRRPPTAT